LNNWGAGFIDLGDDTRQGLALVGKTEGSEALQGDGYESTGFRAQKRKAKGTKKKDTPSVSPAF